MMDSTNGMMFGNQIRRALAMETEDDETAVGGFLQIKVKIDTRKPLRRGILVEGEEDEEDCWCRIYYKFIPNFCYVYGRLDHVEKESNSYAEEEARIRQYGVWMLVTPTHWKGQGEQKHRWLEGGV
jgi:hypothetical protein